ncbi:MAG: 2-hydroxyacyl-CoA dehydratase [Chlorobiales bacterium]|nr:2-hydroxyacyl-CoA dehydratase [Chlorobiales bacterium]
MATTKVFSYPEAIKDKFIATPGLKFKNGRTVSSAEIWEFMTNEAPRRFPYAFDASANNIARFSDDVHFLSGIKRAYLTLTMKDRLLKDHAAGTPTVLVQGGQAVDAYYAAGAIPLRPGWVMQWAQSMEEGLSLRQSETRGINILESGRRTISIDACNQIAAHAAIDNKVVPVDLIAPFLCLRCSDMSFLVETHRNRPNDIPRYLVDYPVEHENKPWAAEYIATELRELIEKIAALSGKKITDEVIFEEIKLENRGRKLAKEITDMWWNAEIPPTNSTDFSNLTHLASDFVGDPVASVDLLEQSKLEIEERIKNKVKGFGVPDNAKRLFICGSCVGPNAHHAQTAGALFVGRDDMWSCSSVLIEEEGDPYLNIAKSMLAYPYEQRTEKRAEWTAEQVTKSRADGVIFMYQWGCNYQTGVARMISDIVKQKTGVPTTFIEVGELGRSEATEQSTNRVEAFIEMV